MANRPIIVDIFNLLKERKMWWMLPALITLLLAGTLVFLGTSTPMSQFIYVLF